MFNDIILILGIVGCLIVIMGIAFTQEYELYTLHYQIDYNLNSRGKIKLQVFHPTLKKEYFWIDYDQNEYIIRKNVKQTIPLKIICYRSPIPCKMRIKEIWIEDYQLIDKFN